MVVSSEFKQQTALQNWVDKLLFCNWFSNVGSDLEDSFQRVDSWKEAHAFQWNEALDEEMNAMRIKAVKLHSLAEWSSNWNPVADKVFVLVDAALKPLRIKCRRLRLSDKIYSDVRSYLRLFFIGVEYFDDPDLKNLGRTCLELALAGRCPCGYEGEYPNGTLVVY